jgi:hypothetical protein
MGRYCDHHARRHRGSSTPGHNVGWKNHGCGFSAMEKILVMGHLLRNTTIGGNACPSEVTGKTTEGDTGCFEPSQRPHSHVLQEVYSDCRGQLLRPSSR